MYSNQTAGLAGLANANSPQIAQAEDFYNKKVAQEGADPTDMAAFIAKLYKVTQDPNLIGAIVNRHMAKQIQSTMPNPNGPQVAPPTVADQAKLNLMNIQKAQAQKAQQSQADIQNALAASRSPQEGGIAQLDAGSMEAPQHMLGGGIVAFAGGGAPHLAAEAEEAEFLATNPAAATETEVDAAINTVKSGGSRAAQARAWLNKVGSKWAPKIAQGVELEGAGKLVGKGISGLTNIGKASTLPYLATQGAGYLYDTARALTGRTSGIPTQTDVNRYYGVEGDSSVLGDIGRNVLAVGQDLIPFNETGPWAEARTKREQSEAKAAEKAKKDEENKAIVDAAVSATGTDKVTDKGADKGDTGYPGINLGGDLSISDVMKQGQAMQDLYSKQIKEAGDQPNKPHVTEEFPEVETAIKRRQARNDAERENIGHKSALESSLDWLDRSARGNNTVANAAGALKTLYSTKDKLESAANAIDDQLEDKLLQYHKDVDTAKTSNKVSDWETANSRRKEIADLMEKKQALTLNLVKADTDFKINKAQVLNSGVQAQAAMISAKASAERAAASSSGAALDLKTKRYISEDYIKLLPTLQLDPKYIKATPAQKKQMEDNLKRSIAENYGVSLGSSGDTGPVIQYDASGKRIG